MADPRAIHEFSSIEPELESSTSLFLLDVETNDPDYTSGYKTGNATVAEIGEKVIHDTEYPLLIDTVDKSVAGGINENKSVIGYNYDEYDDTTTYAAGDLCIYGNTLYKALQATTGNLPTNPTYWTATSIADEIGAINTALSDLIITDITNSIGTTPTGITLVTSESAVYKQGKHIFGTLLFKSTNDLIVNTDNLLITIATAYKANRIQNFFGVTSNSQYNIANACYAYLSTSVGGSCEIAVKAPTSSQKYAKIQIDYLTF